MRFFSEAMKETVKRTNYWSTPDGSEVLVTGVDDNPECSNYGWDDKVLLGPVVEWIRCGEKPASKLMS